MFAETIAEKETKIVELMAENERLRVVVVHAAACNPDATGETAAIALRQIVMHARWALEK